MQEPFSEVCPEGVAGQVNTHTDQGSIYAVTLRDLYQQQNIFCSVLKKRKFVITYTSGVNKEAAEDARDHES
jgi:hypothetical protein